MSQREKGIRQFIKQVLKEWGYKMPRLWFAKHGYSAFLLDPPRLRLHLNDTLNTVLHELIHYRSTQDGLSLSHGLPERGDVFLEEWDIMLKEEGITDDLANQLSYQYQYLWDKLVSPLLTIDTLEGLSPS